MGFHTKYELEKLVHDGPIKTFRAKEIASGKPVFLHLLSARPEQSAELLIERAEALQNLSKSQAAGQPVIEIGPSKDYVATEVLPSFQGLESWVATAYDQAQEQVCDKLRGEMRGRIATGDVAGALQAAQQGAREFPKEVQFAAVAESLALLEQSRQLALQGQSGPSLDRLRAAVEIDPRNPLVRGALLFALTRRAEELSKSQPREAADLAREALDLDPANEAALAITRSLDPEREEFVIWCLSQADKLHRQGDQQGALALLDQGAAKYPDDQRLQQRRAAIRPGTVSPAQPAPPAPQAQSQTQRPGLSTPAVLGRQVRQAVKALGGGLSRLVAASRKKAPALAATLTKLDRKSPLVPALVGVGIAVLLIPLLWLFSNRGVEAEAPPTLGHAVALRSNPPGAVLSVNGESCGASTCEVKLEPGTHFAEATLPGYRPTMVSFEVGAAGLTEPIVVTLPPLLPIIRVSSDLANGTVELDGVELGELEEGEFERQLSDLASGEHTLTIKGSGTTTEMTFAMAPAAIPVLVGAPRTREVKALVVAGFGSAAKLYGDEELSSVQIDGRDTGAKPVLEWNSLSAGSHELQVTSGGKSRKVIFDSQPSPMLAVFVQSDRNVGGLRINTGEDGVTVYLNGEKYRRVTSRGRLLIYLIPKTYQVRAEKAGFRPTKEQAVNVLKGEQVALDFKLEPLPTTATLRIRDGVPGTQVLLDGRAAGVIGPEGTLSVANIEPGRRTIALRKEKFKPREIESTFIANESVDVRGMLESALGTLRIEVTPAEADARLSLRKDGESSERPVSSRTLDLDAGTYTVSASAEGYQDFGATVRLEAEETKTARLTLQRIAEVKPVAQAFKLSDWEKMGGWLHEGDLLVRTGGDYHLAPVEPEPGVYEFAALARQGRRLEWVADFHGKDSHIHYQISRNEFERSRVVAGKRTESVKKPHTANFNDFITVRIDVRSSAVTISLYQENQWIEIDRFEASGVNLADGKFGFQLPGRRQIAVRRMTFTPR